MSHAFGSVTSDVKSYAIGYTRYPPISFTWLTESADGSVSIASRGLFRVAGVPGGVRGLLLALSLHRSCRLRATSERV